MIAKYLPPKTSLKLHCEIRPTFNTMKQLNTLGKQLEQYILRARQQSAARLADSQVGDKVHVAGAGGALTAAYEQLRNAAEYSEEHVLLQHAIRRFYKRIFLSRNTVRIEDSGEELAIELTQAGYVANDSLSESTIAAINQLASTYFEAYVQLEKESGLARDKIDNWTLDVLAVEAEQILNDNSINMAFAQFAHDYFQSSVDIPSLFEGTAPADSEAALYVAVHLALLKSDRAAIRLALLQRYQQQPDQLASYILFNQEIDKLFDSSTTERFYRLADRRGAPLRVLRHVLESDEDNSLVLSNQDAFMQRFEAQIQSDYENINSHINRGIIKSVVFLIITKVIIGIAIEVPYDIAIYGAIIWTPLLLNLFFPPIYMLLLRSTLLLPPAANTRKLANQIEHILYENEGRQLIRRKPRLSFGAAYNVAYAGVFLIVFGGVAWLLWSVLSFDLLHLFIFFAFLSTASFLGFRLSRLIREVESIDSDQNGLTMTRDFLYMPFVVVGRWISEKYARINVVAMALDMIIELPLKTILRLIRQWGAFISSKKDEL